MPHLAQNRARFGAGGTNVLKIIFKSPIFVPFGDNLTPLGTSPDITEVKRLYAASTPCHTPAWLTARDTPHPVT